ncbi:MAG: FAD binding domain-containing protein, partial [Candidatus Delongbacteria bacterium]|nr:FAD binding domain-containing protein [Candidatus Delongbacteria bacterium]
MLSSFDYHAPADLATACTLLDELPQAQVLAGGTDLLVDINSGLKLAEHVVSLKA